VLHNVTYDGRNTFYRLSVSEMTVPYAGMFHDSALATHLIYSRSARSLPPQASI
jgi:hypothetical protein